MVAPLINVGIKAGSKIALKAASRAGISIATTLGSYMIAQKVVAEPLAKKLSENPDMDAEEVAKEKNNALLLTAIIIGISSGISTVVGVPVNGAIDNL